MTYRLFGTLAALLLTLPTAALDAQGKGKGNDKANEHAAHEKAAKPAQAQERGRGNAAAKSAQARADQPSQGKGAQARDAEKARGNPAQARGNDKGRADDVNRGRERAAEVREVGGAVAGPADPAIANRNANAARSDSRFFRAFRPDDAPDGWRDIVMSPRLPERFAGRVAALALARGVPEHALRIRPSNDRVLITNPSGVVLLDLDDRRAREMGAWKVVTLNDRDDDRDTEGAPAFCRSGAGHPNWGRQWCVDKGFGLGTSSDVRWGRAVSVQDVILRPRGVTTGDLTRDVLASVLGDVVFNRLATHAITMGLVDPLAGRWAVEPSGRRVLLVNSGTVPVAEIVDHDKDDRADVLLVALKPW